MPRTRRDAASSSRLTRLIADAQAASLRALRDRKMAACLHAYMRGSAPLFYAALDDVRTKAPVPDAPAVWISGDCHAENIGAIPTGDAGVAHLALNDLDCAVIGNPVYDLVRLSLSMALATMQQGRGGREVMASARSVVDGYLHATLAEAPPPLPERLEKLLKHASKESRRELLDKRAPRKHGERRFALGDRYEALLPAVRADLVAALQASTGVRALLGGAVGDGDRIEVVDVAFRIAGTGSLGCFRAAALLRNATGSSPKLPASTRGAGDAGDARDDEDDALFLVDVKEALAAPTPRAPSRPNRTTPRDDAERLVAASRILWAGSGGEGAQTASHAQAAQTPPTASTAAPMATLDLCGRSCAMRVLRPQEDKLAVDALSPDEAAPVARALGAVAARAHVRQLAPADRRALARALGDDADGVAQWMNPLLATLIGRHATAYFEHVVRCEADSSARPKPEERR